MGISFFNIGLYHYLLLALILFLIGAFGVVISKNVIKILISVEFMLNAIILNFITFASYIDISKKIGYVFSLFYIAIGAIEIAVAIVIFYMMYKEKKSVDIDKYRELNG